MSPGPQPREAIEDVLRRCRALGLLIPPLVARPLTESQLLCGLGWNGGFSRTGSPKTWPNYCGSWRCVKRCAPYQACLQTERIAENVGFFRFSSTRFQSRDKSEKALWVATVADPPNTSALVGDRLRQRAKLLKRVGEAVNQLRLPCDGWVVVVASHELAANDGGRRPLPPQHWTPVEVAACLSYVEIILSSGATRGPVWATPGWRVPEDVTGTRWGAKGRDEILLAEKIMNSEGVTCDPILGLDEKVLWTQYAVKASEFNGDPRCGDCSTAIAEPNQARWVNGNPLCEICQLARRLKDLLDVSHSERDIERRLVPYTFARYASTLEEALRRAGAVKNPDQTWGIPGTTKPPEATEARNAR